MNITVDEKLNLIENYENDKDVLLLKICKLFNYAQPNSNVNINDNVYKDLNIYNDKSVFNTINYSKTLYGEYTLKYWLDNPILDTTLLKMRQNNIRMISKNKKLRNGIISKLEEIRDSETKVLWFWEDLTDEIKSLYDIIYFNLPIVSNRLNSSEIVLNGMNIYKIFGAPIFSVFIPIITFIIPLIIFYIYNPKVSFKSMVLNVYNSFSLMFRLIEKFNFGTKTKYMTIIMTCIYVFLYLQSGYYTIKQSIDTNRIINTLHKKINNIGNFVKNTIDIWTMCKDSGLVLSNIDEEIVYFKEMFSGDIFDDTNIRLLSNKGKVLSVYWRFMNDKDKLIKLLKYIGEIDNYIGLEKLYSSGYCFSRYMNSNTPYISIKGMRHPMLNNPKENSITLGGSCSRNMLITGPNKSGKSFFIKSLAISVLLSQTLGIAPCRRIKLVPFNVINSYLHIPDSIGHSSLFEAEMYRAKEHIEKLKNTDGISFIIMDEIFTSTNFVEGYSSAYAITKRLSQFENSISIITTHFTGLNVLEKETNGDIKNYKFVIEKGDDGNIIYEHKLRKGYSKQYIALDLLKDEGFDKEIIEDAQKTCDELQNKYFV